MLYTYYDVKMNNIKILVAKILIFVILFGIIIIGFLKYIDYLEVPSDNLLNSLNSISESTKNLGQLFDSKLYNLLNGKLQINADTKILSKNTANTDYQEYLDYLQDASLVTNVKFDKKENYLVSNSKITKNNKMYELDYIEDGFGKFIRGNDTDYEKVLSSNFNIKVFDKDVYPLIVCKFIDKLKEYIVNYEVISYNDEININELSINADILNLSLSGEETIKLLNSFISTLVNDSTINDYLNKIYDVSNDNIEDILKGMLNTYHIDDKSDYIFKIFINKSSKDIIEFVFMKDSAALFTYKFINNYYFIDLNGVSYEIKGTKDDLELKINNNVVTTFTYKESDSSFSGTISKDGKYRIEYNSDLLNVDANSTSLSLKMNIYPISIKENMVIEFNSSILVTKDITIVKKNIIDSYENNKSIKNLFEIYLKRVYDYLNETKNLD